MDAWKNLRAEMDFAPFAQESLRVSFRTRRQRLQCDIDTHHRVFTLHNAEEIPKVTQRILPAFDLPQNEFFVVTTRFFNRIAFAINAGICAACLIRREALYQIECPYLKMATVIGGKAAGTGEIRRDTRNRHIAHFETLTHDDIKHTRI